MDVVTDQLLPSDAVGPVRSALRLSHPGRRESERDRPTVRSRSRRSDLLDGHRRRQSLQQLERLLEGEPELAEPQLDQDAAGAHPLERQVGLPTRCDEDAEVIRKVS